MKATIKDLVKDTQLSLGTISKYLNGISVKEKNRVAIENSIKKLNYSVNEFGRCLRTNKSKTIGIVTPYLDDPYAGNIISKMEVIFRKANYSVIVCDTLGDLNVEHDIVDFFIHKRVDGVVSFPTANDGDEYLRLIKNNVPIITIDKQPSGLNVDTFMLNNEEVSYQAVKILIEFGHKKIGVLTGTEGVRSADERYDGYKRALTEAGIPLESRYVRRDQFNLKDNAIKESLLLLSQPDPPTAVLATNYYYTLGVVVAANELMKTIGKEISLFGFDNIMLNDLIRPKLWLVAQPMDEYAHLAAKSLLAQINGTHTGDVGIHICDGIIMEGKSINNLYE